MIKFLDTNIILNGEFLENPFGEKFMISSETFKELENIKSSSNKSDEIKAKARAAVRFLSQCEDSYDMVIVRDEHYGILKEFRMPVSPDNLIIACAFDYHINIDSIVFVTNDVLCRDIAKSVFGLDVQGYSGEYEEKYLGYKDVVLNDDEMAYFYSHMDENTFGCITNEYVIIKDKDGIPVDKYRWDGKSHIRIYNKPIRSQMFGDKIRAKDEYQAMAIDSIMSNPITAITGKQGSGKTLISLVCALHLIESGKYNDIIILFNPLKTRGVADMGFYKGSVSDKAMANAIGNTLISKFGDRYGVDLLIGQGKLKLISMGDIRGMEVTDSSILFITEAQNTSRDILKLCLGRVSSGAKVIIEGDYTSQVDHYSFAGNNNGLKRAIDVLKGEDIFGYVDLKNIWRSKLAELVEKF